MANAKAPSKPTPTKRSIKSSAIPSRRRVRVTLTIDEWAILGAIGRKYQKSVGWVVSIAVMAFLEPKQERAGGPAKD